jgi:hypothetical protein
VEAGQDPALFWRLTLREIAAVMKGAANGLKREKNNRAWLAWHTASLQRAKKMPPLRSLIRDRPARETIRRNWQEQLAIAHQWTAAIKRMEGRSAGSR